MIVNRDQELNPLLSQQQQTLGEQEGTITTNEDGSMELTDDAIEEDLDAVIEDSEYDYNSLLGINLADGYLDDEGVSEVANTVLTGFSEDLESIKDHFEVLKDGVDLLGIKLEEHGALGEWSCGATHPLILENAVKFQAMAINELDHPDGPVRTRIFGNQMNPDIESVANRKQEFMNYFITEEMDDFYSESSKNALSSATFGTAFKLNQWDAVYGTVESSALRADQVITHWNTKSLVKSPRYTCILESSDVEISSKMSAGTFRKLDLDDPKEVGNGDASLINMSKVDINGLGDKLKEITGVEYDCDRVLLHSYVLLNANEFFETSKDDESIKSLEDAISEETGDDEENNEYTEAKYLPFIVTTELHSGKILSIYANWKQDDPSFRPLSYVTDYHFIRGFGFYSLGYVHILGNFQRMLTSIMRSLVDAGTFANIPGGFKLKGSKIAGSTEISPGEFVDIESSAADITKAIMPLPFKEPSAVLSQMYTILEGRGQMFANAAEGVLENSANYGKVGTTTAMLEVGEKLTTAIIRDYHRARRNELKIIERLIVENVKEYPYQIDGVQDLAKTFQEDFGNPTVKIVPVSDPNIPNKAQRLSLATQRIQLAQQFPQVHDTRMALYNIYKTMGDENPEKILPPPQQAKPQDPVTDISTAVGGGPISAFPGQAHQAYITVFNSWSTLPEVANNPMMGPAINAVTACMRQHMIMDYQEKIQAMTGQGQPSGAGTDPNTLAMLQAQAAQQMAQISQQMQQMAQNAQDPAVMLAKVQEQKVQVDREKMDSKEKIEFARLALDAKRLELDNKKVDSGNILGNNKITATLVNADAQRQHDKAKTQHTSMIGQAQSALDVLAKAAMHDSSIEHQAREGEANRKVKPTKGSKSNK